MPIPKYDEMMLPILRVLADGEEHSQPELADKMAEHFRLTPEERAAAAEGSRDVSAPSFGLGWV